MGTTTISYFNLEFDVLKKDFKTLFMNNFSNFLETKKIIKNHEVNINKMLKRHNFV